MFRRMSFVPIFVLLLSLAHASVVIQNKDLNIINGSLSISGGNLYVSGTATVGDLSCSHCVALGSETSGNYVAGITAGTGISVSGGSGVGVTTQIAIAHPSIACSSGQAIQSFDLGAGTKVCTSVVSSCSACDSRFVNVTGDTMSGALKVNSTITANNIVANGGSYTARNTAARLIIPGPTSDFALTVQDGTGRVQAYWNSSPGTSPTYLVSNEAAGKILFNPAGNPWFVLYWAPSGTAGGSISWQEKFAVDTAGAIYASKFVDLDNSSYYVDPSSSSNMNTITAVTIRATSVLQAGDLLFKNHFRFVEDGNDAIILLNEHNQPIMRIDDHGNVWIKGQIRRWQ